MFDWGLLSAFERNVIISLVALVIIGFVVIGKLNYLIRLKEIELKKQGILEQEQT